ncbi:MAG: sigma 54-interacting transcriptional regulator [Acidobacteriota bacterium]
MSQATRRRDAVCLALRGDVEGITQTFRLGPGRNRVGRGGQNEVCLASSGVSKLHAVVVAKADHLWIEDLASKNGTFVNRTPARGVRAGLGDHLHFGPVTLRVISLQSADVELAIELPASSLPATQRRANLGTSTVHETGEGDTDLSMRFVDGYVPGRSTAMQTVYRQLRPVLATDLPILLYGETGVGKEGLARSLHLSSSRSEGPFVAINCAAIPDDLLEAELFGIGAGVATGVTARRGKFELARTGTLFLDEIGQMRPSLQAKLLRALQENEILPLGESPVALDVRIIAATNTDLERQLATGEMRRDLYYRLAGLVAWVPPLRQRHEDIPPLVEHFLNRYGSLAGNAVVGITRGALDDLVTRPWPGNVRQLEHEVRRLIYQCPERQPIDSAMLDSLRTPSEVPGTPKEAPKELPGTPNEVLGTASSALLSATADQALEVLDLRSTASLRLAWVERQVVEEALRRCSGNRSQAARVLGISREALRRRLRRYAAPEHDES